MFSICSASENKDQLGIRIIFAQREGDDVNHPLLTPAHPTRLYKEGWARFVCLFDCFIMETPQAEGSLQGIQVNHKLLPK